MPPKRDSLRRGSALVEASLLAPLLFFLFLGLTNFGFFVYAFITVGNAARAAAQATARTMLVTNTARACGVALREMRSLPNVAPLAATWPCSGPPLFVPPLTGVVVMLTTDNTPALTTRVTVSYDTIQLFPLPFLSGKMTINRTAQMRVMS